MEAFTEWLQDSALSTETANQYISDLQQFTDWLCQPITSVTSAQLRSFQKYLIHLNYSPVTVNGKLTAISKWFEYASEKRLIPTIPELPSRLRPVSTFAYLTKGEQNRLQDQLKTMECIRTTLLIKLFLVVGLRLSEVRSLKPENIKFNNNVPVILLKNRTIPIGPDLTETAAMYFADCKPSRLVFASPRNTQLSRQSIYTTINRHTRGAGIGSISPRVLRNTCIRNLIAANISHDHICALVDIKKTVLKSIIRKLGTQY